MLTGVRLNSNLADDEDVLSFLAKFFADISNVRGLTDEGCKHNVHILLNAKLEIPLETQLNHIQTKKHSSVINHKQPTMPSVIPGSPSFRI